MNKEEKIAFLVNKINKKMLFQNNIEGIATMSEIFRPNNTQSINGPKTYVIHYLNGSEEYIKDKNKFIEKLEDILKIRQKKINNLWKK